MSKDTDRYLIVYIKKIEFLLDETLKDFFLNSAGHLFAL